MNNVNEGSTEQTIFDFFFGSTVEEGINQYLNFSNATVGAKNKPVTDLTGGNNKAAQFISNYVNSGFTSLLLTLFSFVTGKEVNDLIANFSQRSIANQTENPDVKIEAVVRRHLANNSIVFLRTSDNNKISLAANPKLLQDSELKLFTVEQISTGLEETLKKVEQERQEAAEATRQQQLEAAEERLLALVQRTDLVLTEMSKKSKDCSLSEETIAGIALDAREKYPVLNLLKNGRIQDALRAKHKEVIRKNIAKFVYDKLSEKGGSPLNNESLVEAIQDAFKKNPPETVFQGDELDTVINFQRGRKVEEAEQRREERFQAYQKGLQEDPLLGFIDLNTLPKVNRNNFPNIPVEDNDNQLNEKIELEDNDNIINI